MQPMQQDQVPKDFRIMTCPVSPSFFHDWQKLQHLIRNLLHLIEKKNSNQHFASAQDSMLIGLASDMSY